MYQVNRIYIKVKKSRFRFLINWTAPYVRKQNLNKHTHTCLTLQKAPLLWGVIWFWTASMLKVTEEKQTFL